MSKKCELCENVNDMDFNAIIPISEKKSALVTGDICFTCYGIYPSDVTIAIALFVKRKNETKDNGQ